MAQLALWVLWVTQINTRRAAREAACLVLSVDKLSRTPRSKKIGFFWL
jgi:hypothetical protein